MKRILSAFESPEKKILVLPTMVNAATNGSKETMTALQDDPDLAPFLLPLVIRQDVKLSYAAASKRSIWEYDARSRAAEDYAKLVDYFVEMVPHEEQQDGVVAAKNSFAVDREEIEVNSDWVDAVMARPGAPGTEESPPATPEPSPPRCIESRSSLALFLRELTKVPQTKKVRQAKGCSSVEKAAAVANKLPVAESAGVEHSGIWRPRPIHRITDDLTPGQYAVYRLMHEAGQGSDEFSRIYTGGYADLRRLTGLSKRGIQNIIRELQTKQVIRVSQKHGHHRTETTSYIVPDAEKVVEVWWFKGWRYVDAVGKSKVLTGSPEMAPQ